MKKFETLELHHTLKNIGINEGDNLLIHNSLLKFGIPKDHSISMLPEIIYENLLSIISSSGTIVVPTFNFDFCSGIPFDRQKTPSKGMGAFSEFIRLLPESRRSYHPMQSVAAVGQNRDYIIKDDTISSFSLGGPFDKLLGIDAKVVLLGADFNTVSMIHWVEEKHKVPYRYWKSFNGIYNDNHQNFIKEYKMYVRSLEINPILKLYHIEKQLVKQNKLYQSSVGDSLIKLFDLKDFVTIAENCITSNPYFFVSNHPNFEKYN